VVEAQVRTGRDGVDGVLDGASRRVQVEEEAPGVFVWRDGDTVTPFHCVREGRVVHLFWKGVAYRFEEEAEGSRRSARHAHAGLEAPMPGKVIALRVEVGQEVRKGAEVLVVEAMKMENVLRAPQDGRVTAIACSVGDMVNPGVVLVEIE